MLRFSYSAPDDIVIELVKSNSLQYNEPRLRLSQRFPERIN